MSIPHETIHKKGQIINLVSKSVLQQRGDTNGRFSSSLQHEKRKRKRKRKNEDGQGEEKNHNKKHAHTHTPTLHFGGGFKNTKHSSFVLTSCLVEGGGGLTQNLFIQHSSGLGVRAHPTSFPVSSTSAPSRPSSSYYIFNNNSFINTLHHPPPKQNANQKHQWRV